MDTAITIIETSAYHRKSGKELSDDECRAVIDYLALHPEAGDVMQGTGGIRKLRWGEAAPERAEACV